MIHKRQGNKFFMPDGWKEKIEKAICPVCDKENKRGYRCCSPKCTVEFWKHCYWSSQLKDKCFERDNYTCRKCGVNNKKLEEWSAREIKWWSKGIRGINYEGETGDIQPEKVYFEADHIVPIALGGAEYDLDNYQTLCDKCHKKKTASEGKEFARARRSQKTIIESIKEGKQAILI